MLSAILRRLLAARALCRRIGLDGSGSVVTFLGAVLFSMLNKSSPTAAMKARAVAMQTTATTNTTTSTPVTTTSNSSDACIIALTPNNEQGVSITNFNNFGSDCSILSNATATGSDSSASMNMANFNNGTIHNDQNNAIIWTRGNFTQTSSTGSKNAFVADAVVSDPTGTLYDPYATGNAKALGTPSPG